MIIRSNDQLYKKFDEAMRGLVAFNAAGIAGVIAFASKSGSMSLPFRIVGIIFLVGIFSGVAAWVFSVGGTPTESEEWNRGGIGDEVRRITIALYISAGAFLAGVTIAFFLA